MNTAVPLKSVKAEPLRLPEHRDAFYGGEWHKPKSGRYVDSINPGTAESLGPVADCDAADIDAAVGAAKKAFDGWRNTPPFERARLLKRVANMLREHAEELAMIDAADCGNPVHEMVMDATVAAAQIDFYAGLVTEIKGASIPMGPGVVNFTVREPRGVVGRIIPFNHPFMFCAGKIGAPVATGNTVVMKPPEQAPLSSLRLAELIGGILPPGVFNVVPGGREAGSSLTTHRDVAMIALIGSVPTGRAVMKAAADTLKPVMLELGGKNALIAYPDADPDEVATAVVGGMNFTWCGQSCGSTSRAFIHEKIYEAVLAKVKAKIAHLPAGHRYRPLNHHGRHHLQDAVRAHPGLYRLGQKGRRAAALRRRHVHRTRRWPRACLHRADGVRRRAADSMRIAREEIFGPVLSIFKWSDEAAKCCKK
jgi:betaine-aldehyde dehydrogenase